VLKIRMTSRVLAVLLLAFVFPLSAFAYRSRPVVLTFLLGASPHFRLPVQRQG
jgi:hypothetical protein